MTDGQHNDLLVGQRFHDFRVEERLAEGGMGAVYLLRHMELPAITKVLKVARPELLEMPDPSARESVRQRAELFRASNLERFEQEALAISQLDHPNIATIDGIHTIDGRRCILMPFLKGQPLDRLLASQGGRLAPHYVLHISLRIAHALAHAHQVGIVHRDLKPGNVFIVPTGNDPLELKVIDFGIAKLHGTNPATKTLNTPLGTPYFMATEQWENPSAAGPTADVFSLGVMIRLMVTGQYPWGEIENTYALYMRQLNDPPDGAPPGMMPPGWDPILCAALSADPRRRPQSMRDLMRPLALSLAPIPGIYPSGVELLQNSVASEWLDESAPTDATARNYLGGSAPLRAQPGTISLVSLPPLNVVTTSRSNPIATTNARRPPGGAASGSQPSPGAASSSDAAPVAAIADTTLGSSAGVVSTSTRRSWRLALVGVGTAALVGLGVFGVAATLRRQPTDNAAVASQPRAPATPATANAPASATVAPAASERPASVLRGSKTPPTVDAGTVQPPAPVVGTESLAPAPKRPADSSVRVTPTSPTHAEPHASLRPRLSTGDRPTTPASPPIENTSAPARTTAPPSTPSHTDDDDIDPNDVGGRARKER